MYPQYWTPSIGGTYQNRKAEAAAQKYGAAASAFYLLRPLRVPTVPFRLIPPLRKGVFARRICGPAFPGMAVRFAERSYYTREKSIKTLLRPFIPPFLTDFTMFFMKKALQMNFKNILYNYKLSFFMQTFSYRFVWGRQACAFRTASALR